MYIRKSTRIYAARHVCSCPCVALALNLPRSRQSPQVGLDKAAMWRNMYAHIATELRSPWAAKPGDEWHVGGAPAAGPLRCYGTAPRVLHEMHWKERKGKHRKKPNSLLGITPSMPLALCVPRGTLGYSLPCAPVANRSTSAVAWNLPRLTWMRLHLGAGRGNLLLKSICCVCWPMDGEVA